MRRFHYRILVLLLIGGIGTCLPSFALAQRDSRKEKVDPASPGMVLYEPGMNVHPQGSHSDDAGDTPDPGLPVTDIDERDPVLENMEISRWSMWEVAPGSEIGRSGDFVCEFTGLHFLDGESAPVMYLGDGMRFDRTYVTDNGKTVLVLIPSESAAAIRGQEFDEVILQNAGGRNRDRAMWVRRPITTEKMTNAMDGAAPAQFVYRDYSIARK